jgi:hypothetical protein
MKSLKRKVCIMAMGCLLSLPHHGSASDNTKYYDYGGMKETGESSFQYENNFLNYSENLIDIEDKNVDPIGKIVRYREDMNVKPLIMERTKQNHKNRIVEDDEEREELIHSFLNKVATGKEQKFTNKFFKFLRENDLVFYELGEKKKGGTVSISSTTGSDLSIGTPFITYDSYKKTFSIYGGFEFIDSRQPWFNEVSSGYIGGQDLLGIHLSNGANGAAMVSQSLVTYFEEDYTSSCKSGLDSTKSDSTTSRDGNISSNDGVVFRYQDSKVTLSGNGCTVKANNFGSGSVRATYDYKFANANGNAKVQYAHTWSKTGIDAISMGWAKFEATWTGTDKSYTTKVLSGSDRAY